MPEFFQRQPDGWYRKRYQHSPREWGCLVGTFYHLVATPPEGPGVHVSVETLVTKTASPLLQKTPFYCTFLDLQGYIYIYSYIDIRIYIYIYIYFFVCTHKLIFWMMVTHVFFTNSDGWHCWCLFPIFARSNPGFWKVTDHEAGTYLLLTRLPTNLMCEQDFCKGFTIEGWLQTLQKEIHPYCWWPQYLY